MARSDFKLAVPNEIEIASAVQDAAAVRADLRRTRNIDPGKLIAAARGYRHDESSLEPCAEVLLKLRSEEHTSELQSLMRFTYAALCLQIKTEERISRNA